MKQQLLVAGMGVACAALAGCADSNMAAVSPAAGSVSMAQYLSNPDVLASVNTCVASPAGQAAYVSDVALSGMGNVRVTLVDIGGQRRTCTVDPATKQVVAMDLTGRDVTQVFIPARLSPNKPLGQCLNAQQVNQGGVMAGWLLTRNAADECRSVDWLQSLNKRG